LQAKPVVLHTLLSLLHSQQSLSPIDQQLHLLAAAAEAAEEAAEAAEEDLHLQAVVEQLYLAVVEQLHLAVVEQHLLVAKIR
jgi:rRNA maturation endonuclease Nob1